jgi:hypothetical protein
MRNFSLVLVSLFGLTTSSLASTFIAGDSLAVGVSSILHYPTKAKVGVSSCVIENYIPLEFYDRIIISAGTNDPLGRCLDGIREKVRTNEVVWIVPVNGARSHVLDVAHKYHDKVVYYIPSRNKHIWPHPDSYRSLAEELRN